MANTENHQNLNYNIIKKIYDLDDFVPESFNLLEEYSCNLCKSVYISPVMDTCGHIFCKECFYSKIKNINSSSESPIPCPINKKKFIELKELNKIKFMEIILEKQSHYCKNRNLGCPWIGKLACLESHIFDECQKQITECEFYGCEIRLPRENLKEHRLTCDYRKIKCKNDCDPNLFLIAKDEIHHLNVCRREKILCPNECGIYVERADVENHGINICVNHIIDCNLKEIGCDGKYMKKNSILHNQSYDDKHKLWIVKYLNKVSEEFSKMIENRLESKKKLVNETLQRIFDFYSRSGVHVKKSKRKHQIKKIKRSNNNNTFENKVKIKNILNEKKRKRLNEIKDLENENTLDDCYILMDSEPDCNKIDNPYFIINYDNENSKILNFYQNDENGNFKLIKHIGSFGYNFIFLANINFNHDLRDGKFIWKINFTKIQDWAAFGMCIKEDVIKNNYTFNGLYSFDHGFLVISNNGYLWNSSNPQENNKKLENFPKLNKGDSVTIDLNLCKNEINFNFQITNHGEEFEEYNDNLNNPKNINNPSHFAYRITLIPFSYQKHSYESHSLIPCIIYKTPESTELEFLL